MTLGVQLCVSGGGRGAARRADSSAAAETCYRAMHYSAKRGLAIACRLSVCLSVRPSVTLVDHDHTG